MNPTFVRALQRSAVRMNQAIEPSMQAMPAGKWFGTMGAVAVLLGSGVFAMNWIYADSKIDRIFHKERRAGGVHQ